MNSTGKKFSLIILYIILMTFAFTTNYGDVVVNKNVQYIIAIIIIFVSFFNFISQYKNKENISYLNCFFKMYFIPPLLIHLYTIALMLIGIVDSAYFSTNISMYIPILLALSSVHMFKENAFKYNLIALIFSWLLSILSSIASKGINIIPYAIMQGYFGISNSEWGINKNYFELHDLILSLGCVLVYFIYYKNVKEKLSKKQIYIILLILIILALGIKRITILGVLIAFVFIKCIKHISKEKKIKACKLIGIMILIVCYIYIYILFNSNVLYEFCAKHNINLMGRDYYYDAIVTQGKFSVNFLGLGRNSVTKILTEQYEYLHVGGVHSDILKSYMENGFVVFGLWLWYYLIKITKTYAKKFDILSAVLYFSLTIYTFALYFTDNVENYFIYQIFYIVIPSTYAIKQQKSKK